MRRILVLSAALALAGLAVWHYLDDLEARKPVYEAASRFTMDIRRPIDTQMIAYAPSADFAALVLATSALSDALGTKRLTLLTPDERRAWLDVPLYLDEELSAAIEQQLAAMRRNPGWPLHRYFLGKLAYTRDRRSLGRDIDPHKWLPPLVSASRAAPRHEPAVETLAGVILEAWSVLPEQDRAIAPAVLGSAFEDPQFVRLAFDVAIDVVGRDVAIHSLPDDPATLNEAARTLGRRGDVEEAAAIYKRWETAEWRARSEDLEAMRERMEHGDWRGLMNASVAWGSRHNAGDFDSTEALRQLEDVLELWPSDHIGSWNNDRRAEIARFVLDGRLSSFDSSVLAATVASLANTPPPVRARVALAAGDRLEAESLVSAAGSEGSFEWTDYFVDLARASLLKGDLQGSFDAISRISPVARKECDVLVVRRQAGEDLEPPVLAVTDDSGTVVEEAWSKNGMLGICVDPLSSGAKTLVVEVETSEPTLFEWGLNGGRRDTRLIDGADRIVIPLRGLSGRNVVYTRALWGTISSRTARIE